MTTNTITYSQFISIYSKLNNIGLDIRLGQLFNILFIKRVDNNPLVQDMFNACGIEASQMISDWMEDCHIDWGYIPIPSDNLESIKEAGGGLWDILKSYINQNELA